jgi:hypothetical protein
MILSNPNTADQKVTLIGYPDSARLRRLAAALEVEPRVVRRPRFKDTSIAATTNHSGDRKDELVELEGTLRDVPNVVLQGPPGTGKSSLALAFAETLARKIDKSADECRLGRLLNERAGDFTSLLTDTTVLELPIVWEFVQLHPGYAYDDLVRRIVPSTGADGHLRMQVQDGLLPHLCRLAAARGPDRPVMLIMDEINRCNLAAVLGEFLLAIEAGHRGVPVRLQVQGDGLEPTVAVPPNLWIVGTMNTADRSIALVDYAVRRRLRFLDVHAQREAIQRWYGPEDPRAELVSDLFDSCNSGLPPRLMVGHALFLVAPDPTETWPDRLARRIAYEVLPLLRDYTREGLRDATSVYIGGMSLSIEGQRQAEVEVSRSLREALSGASGGQNLSV